MDDQTKGLIIARAVRLCLLTGIHQAERDHRPTVLLRQRLVLVVADLVAMEARK